MVNRSLNNFLHLIEVTLEDGTVLWSKLSMDEGKQNVPSVFPSDEQIMKLVGEKFGLKYEGIKLEKAAIYSEGTVVGVW